MSEDDIHSALGSIYSQRIAANPPAAARPNVTMETSGLAPTYDENQRTAGVAGMPGASPNLVSATPGYTAAVGFDLINTKDPDLRFRVMQYLMDRQIGQAEGTRRISQRIRVFDKHSICQS